MDARSHLRYNLRRKTLGLEHEDTREIENTKREGAELEREAVETLTSRPDKGLDQGEAGARPNYIGTLNEKPLHATLKNWYARPDDRFEVRVDGFFIDIVRPRPDQDDLLIEIQTKNLFAMKRKLTRLVETHPVRLVHPIGQEKWIVRLDEDGEVVGRRRSPKHGGPEMVFAELVSFPNLMQHPNFTLEVLLIREEEVRVRDESVNWRRRGWATNERRLLEVVESRVFEQPADLLALLPLSLADPFTPVQLTRALDRPAWLARKMTYCLREMGVLAHVGKRGRSNLFTRAIEGGPDG